MKIAVDNILDVAKWFLHTQPMTHKKLQKLLYYSYGIYLVQNNTNEEQIEKTLFVNKFEAWVHGPVDPTVYALFKNSGINLLSLESIDTYNFDVDVINALNKTIELYGDYSADELENISHNQAPWKNARRGIDSMDSSNNPLLDSDIYKTFKKELING